MLSSGSNSASKENKNTSPLSSEPSSPFLQQNTRSEYVDVLGVNVSVVDVDSLHRALLADVVQNNKSLILHVNVHMFNLIHANPWLKGFLNNAEIVFCDGAGVRLGAYILGHRLPKRITYADWMWQLAELCETSDLSLYFLGGKPGIAEKSAAVLALQYPNLRILGCQHGYFDKSQGSQENEEVVREINLLKPNILVVGFGMPLQEAWLRDNWMNIDANIALTAGAAFDYISGELKRAPKWMTDNGLEWLGRLIIEPARLWRRYVVGNPIFLWRVFLQRYISRGTSINEDTSSQELIEQYRPDLIR